MSILEKYNEYYELNKIIETNDDVFALLTEFNTCINKSCSNCLKHSNGIAQLFSKLKINENCDLIKNKFTELHKNKLEYEQMTVFHNKLKLNNCIKSFELLYMMLENEKNNFEKLVEQSNDITLNNFKMFLQDNINMLEQNNYIIELEQTTTSVNQEYLMLLEQIEEANIINNKINSMEIELSNINKQIENYEQDKELLTQIDINKNKIKELKNNKNKYKLLNEELSNLNYKLENINNFEYNTQLYGQINNTKKNAHLITQNIININNEYIIIINHSSV